ncbi:protein of unknown function [Kyrpidia spormannii]|uniref:Uncharacterized protein n=1 Tax=Kyrpidia spormannii TaxID=2055160 RepID=A0ACA8ZBU3_9BACL|nr:protein of unknown function [Kyrpidia spormannii]
MINSMFRHSSIWEKWARPAGWEVLSDRSNLKLLISTTAPSTGEGFVVIPFYGNVVDRR